MEMVCNSQEAEWGWGEGQAKVRLQLESGFSLIHRGSGAQSGFHPEARAWPFIPKMPVSHWLKSVRVWGAEGHQQPTFSAVGRWGPSLGKGPGKGTNSALSKV